MRGLLKMTSQRSPYLRAGLGWPTREPVLADIRTLDGERLLELVTDPVLTVMIGTDGDTFRPFPAPAPGEKHSGWQLQMMIDALAEELPPIGADAPAEPDDQAAIIVELETARGMIETLTNERDGATTRVLELELQVATLTSERDTATGQVAALEAEVAKLAAAGKRSKPNTKPAAAEVAP
jgi:hypothetical protein